ncbi:MAG TPA: transposase [Thermoanaerobaculia bacterium]|jgi:putative transposase
METGSAGGREPGAIFAVTVATWRSRPVFDDAAFGRECVELLAPACARAGASLYAYCLMADHGCLLLGVPGRASLPAAVTLWKSLCGQAWRRRGGASLWQRGYAESLLPDAGALREAAAYVLGKPVRAGLVRDPADYPLCGGPAAAR